MARRGDVDDEIHWLHPKYCTSISNRWAWTAKTERQELAQENTYDIANR